MAATTYILENTTVSGQTTIIEDIDEVTIRNCHFGLISPTVLSDSLTIGKADIALIEDSVIRWSTDECLGAYDVERFTVRDSLIYESLNDPGLHPSGGGLNGTAHGAGGLYWTRKANCQVKFERVLFAHHNYRAFSNMSARISGSVVGDFVNCCSFDTWNYYFQDTGFTTDAPRNIRGCLFIQPFFGFQESMWVTPSGLYIDDSWCIDRFGNVTSLESQLSEELQSRLSLTPFEVDDMLEAEPAEGLLERLIYGAIDNITLDFDDMRVLSRIAAWRPGGKAWTGVIDERPVYIHGVELSGEGEGESEVISTTYSFTANEIKTTAVAVGNRLWIRARGTFGLGTLQIQTDIAGLGDFTVAASVEEETDVYVDLPVGAQYRLQLIDSTSPVLSVVVIDSAVDSNAVATDAATAAGHTPVAISTQIANDVTDGTNNWDDGKPAMALTTVSAMNSDATQTTARTNAATAATEIGKVPRLATAIAAGATARRTKVAATSTTLDETLGATP